MNSGGLHTGARRIDSGRQTDDLDDRIAPSKDGPVSARPSSLSAPLTPVDPSPKEGLAPGAGALTGRQTESRQLRKAITQARQGHGRPILLSGDMGLGKSFLLETLRQTVDGPSSLWVKLDLANCPDPAQLPSLLLQGLRTAARQALRHHLLALNTIAPRIADASWTLTALTQAVSVLAACSTEPAALQRDALYKTLKGSPSVDTAQAQGAADQVINCLRSPWLPWAVAVSNDQDPLVQSLAALAHQCEHQPTLETDALSRLAVITRTLMAALDELAASADVAAVWELDHWDAIADWPEMARQPAKEWLGQWLATLNEQRDTHHLIVVAVRSESQSTTLGGVLEGTSLASVSGALVGSEGLSPVSAAGKPLNSLFRSRILLAPWTMAERGEWLTAQRPKVSSTGHALQVAHMGLPMPAAIEDSLAQWSQGNPFWLTIAYQLVSDHWKQGLLIVPPTASGTGSALDLLGFEHPDELMEWLMSRLLLPFLHQEEALCQVLQALFDGVGTRAFSMEPTLLALTTQTEQPPGFLFEVLRHLFLLNLVQALPVNHLTLMDETVEDETSAGDPKLPCYRLASRPLTAVMRQWLRKRHPNQPKKSGKPQGQALLSHSIERLIPLSLQTGELTPDKLQAVVALGSRLGHGAIIASIEHSLLAALEPASEASLATRLTALNSLPSLRCASAWQALASGSQDSEQPALYRETCLRGLLIWLADQPGLPEGQSAGPLALQLQTAFLSESDLACQTLLLTVLSQLRQGTSHLALTDEFLAQSDSVLTEAQPSAPKVLQRAMLTLLAPELAQRPQRWLPAFIAALGDPDAQLQTVALDALTHQADEPAVAEILKHLSAAPETVPQVRQRTFATLARSTHVELAVAAFEPLLEPTLWRILDEPTWLSLLRSLADLPSHKAQALLYDWLERAHRHQQLTPVLVWRWVRTLGQVGDSDMALQVLDKLASFSQESDYLGAAFAVARANIAHRRQHPPEAGRRFQTQVAPVVTMPVEPSIDVVSGCQPSDVPPATVNDPDATTQGVSHEASQETFEGTFQASGSLSLAEDGISDLLDDLLNELKPQDQPPYSPGSPTTPERKVAVITDEAFDAFQNHSATHESSPVQSTARSSTSTGVMPGFLSPFLHKVKGWLGLLPAPAQLPDNRRRPAGLLSGTSDSK